MGERGLWDDQRRKVKAGRKRIDPMILFKMLVLQQLFNHSDQQLEFQVYESRSLKSLSVLA